jgi:hypothetical protein
MTVVVTATKITGVPDYNDGPYKVPDPGHHVRHGHVCHGREQHHGRVVGLKTIDLVRFGTQAMTGGTSGATINWIGVTYASNRQSVTFQQYECAATGLAGAGEDVG